MDNITSKQSSEGGLFDKLAFPERRTMALAAYDIAIKQQDVLEPAGQLIGELWYPGLLPQNQRQHGSIVAVTILSLDKNLREKNLFGGPALCEDTRRLLVADILASAYQQSKDWGKVHNKIKEWYPEGSGAPLFPIEAYLKPEAFAEQMAKSRTFRLEKVLGVQFGDNLRETYATLFAVIHGTLWLMDADHGSPETRNEPGQVSALQNALYKFANVIDPLFKGEVVMVGEG